jgi:phosphatidylglycerol lysyltransferase
MTALVQRSPRARAWELIRRHGHDTVSFQGLEMDYQYWFDGEEAVVSYVDTGGAWIAAGSPVTALERLGEVAGRFTDAARAAERRAAFFCAEQPLAATGLAAIQIGEQPVWDPARWGQILAGSSSLRYQLRRAHNKGVAVRRLEADELAIDSVRSSIDQLARHWLAAHRMPPMSFLVQHDPVSFAAERLTFVAEREGALIGLASVIPVYRRGRLFIEELVRDPGAPNGTSELLVDAVMRSAGTAEVTLGLAPLSGSIARWLRIARWLGAPLYDFAGLRAFKAKLLPHAWEPVYLCAGDRTSKLLALRDSLRAFAGGSLIGFAGRTLVRRR